MQTYKRGLLTIIALIIISSAALAFIGHQDSRGNKQNHASNGASDKLLSLQTELIQDKILTGSDGKVGLALELAAVEQFSTGKTPVQPVDLVLVLDRSGSMGGKKLKDARQAVLRLMERMASFDRLALVTYSNGVQSLAPLMPLDDSRRDDLAAVVNRIGASGGTNLGAGLQRGIEILKQNPEGERQRKLILISDGLANQGITDPQALAQMAASGLEYNFSVSTVGVGYDFNEVLMTTLADHGSGRYHFLEDPNAFAQVFEDEFQTARNVVAGALEIRIPLKDHVRLVEAGGYPVKQEGNVAVLHPGDLRSGQRRKLFLTFQVPTDSRREFELQPIQIRYQHEGQRRSLTGDRGWTVACISDPKEVMASIDEKGWSDQVLQEDFSRLKEEVADAIRKGEKKRALSRVKIYEERNRSMNASVGSAAVAQNLDEDVKDLRQNIEETFAGPPAAVAEKKKQQSKALQYESYQIRRDQKK
jgi:Ca-activated chloride channel family protein